MHARTIAYLAPPAISWDVQLVSGRWTLQTPGRPARPKTITPGSTIAAP